MSQVKESLKATWIPEETITGLLPWLRLCCIRRNFSEPCRSKDTNMLTVQNVLRQEWLVRQNELLTLSTGLRICWLYHLLKGLLLLLKRKGVLDMTLSYIWWWSWISLKCGVTAFFLLVVVVRIPSIGQKDLFKIYFIWLEYFDAIKLSIISIKNSYPIGWGFRIHLLQLYRGVTLPTTCVLYMTLNNLMVSFQ